MKTTKEAFQVLTFCDHCPTGGMVEITPEAIEEALEQHGFLHIVCNGCRKKYTRRIGIMLSVPAVIPARFMQQDEEE